MCITNEGILEKGKLDNRHWYTIDRITLKLSNGKRLKRYAVCVDGRWDSNQQMTLREARTFVEQVRREYNKPAFEPVTADAMREYARSHGNSSAHDLLLLGGYGFFAGTCKEYDELLKEFEGGAANAV